MKINNLNVTGGQVNIADKIDKVEYSPNFGISNNEFQLLKSSLKSLNEQQLGNLKEYYVQIENAQTVKEKTSSVEKAKKFFIDLGLSFVSSLTIDGIVQIGQAFIN